MILLYLNAQPLVAEWIAFNLSGNLALLFGSVGCLGLALFFWGGMGGGVRHAASRLGYKTKQGLPIRHVRC